MNHYFFKQNCVFFFFIKIIKNKTNQSPLTCSTIKNQNPNFFFLFLIF